MQGQCRICLNQKSCSSLYEVILERYYLPTVIEYVCGVQISALDEPSSLACSECATALVQAENIVRKFRSSHELLWRQKSQLLNTEQEEVVLEAKKRQKLILDRENEENDIDEEQLRQEEEQLRLEEEVKLEEEALRAEKEAIQSEAEDEIDDLVEWVGDESTTGEEYDVGDDNDSDYEAQLSNEKEFASTPRKRRKSGKQKNLKVNRQKEFHFRCDLCEFESNFAKYFRNHLTEVHQVEKPRIFKCGQCSEAYVEHRSLREHVARVHEGQPRRQRFLCSDCGKNFGKNSHLVRHSYVHRPEERPFQCDFCPMLFVNMSSAKRHMVTSHSEGRPFVCDLCDKAFGCIYNLRAHRKRIHSDIKAYDCSRCQSSFRLIKSLKSHQLRGCR